MTVCLRLQVDGEDVQEGLLLQDGGGNPGASQRCLELEAMTLHWGMEHWTDTSTRNHHCTIIDLFNRASRSEPYSDDVVLKNCGRGRWT